MRIGKRLLDLTLGSVLALVSLPFIVVTAAISVVCLRTWPFFVQRRVGRKQHMFTMIKVRTLPRRTPSYTAKTNLHPESLPRAAALLRRTHLDELPQLLLVPLGKMSLVGPRPEMRFLHERFGDLTAEVRTSVRPGCTGLWQISERSSQLINEAPEYDRYYLLHQSVRLDLWILWRTFRVMFTRARPISFNDIPRWALPNHRDETDSDLATAHSLPAPAQEAV